MSVETPKIEETTPTPTKPTETTGTAAETTATTSAEPTTTAPEIDSTAPTDEAGPAVETSQNEAVVTAVPATEGVLAYKGAPGLLNKFRFVKLFFWFSEEPLTQEAVDAYVKNEKADVAHHNAAWAQETGKGVFFYAKRAEDKATPSGMILLADATNVTNIGANDFSFKVGTHTHKFEAASSQERDSWVVAIEKIIEESKDIKADITGRESYKKTIEGFSSSAAAGSTSPIKSDTPKKSLDATAATDAAAIEPAPKADASRTSSVDDSKKHKEAEKQAKKERSLSRKRASVFGLFGKKDEDKEAKKEEKAEKKAEKEHAKELKKAEAEHKKEEAKAEHDASKAKEAAEATAIAAAPAAVAGAAVEKEEKRDDKPTEETSPVTSPTEKKNKRASVFGGFFGKNKATGPSAEKEITPESPAKDETTAVSETAPKLEEPIDTKPIDAAAVTAPVDAPESSTAATSAPAADESKSAEPTSAAETATTPKAEKKHFFASFIKKQEKKEEPKEEKTSEEVAAAPETAAESSTATEPAAESPAKETDAHKEERPAREKRRTSLFSSLGTLKRKTEKSPEPNSAGASEEVKSPETKREKSPLPSKFGVFRKASRSAKTELSAAEENKTETTSATEAAKTEEAQKVTGETDTPANATVVDPTTSSKIVGDVVPDNLHSTVHDVVTTAPEASKTTA